MSRVLASCVMLLALHSSEAAQQKVFSAGKMPAAAAQHSQFEISGTLVDAITGQPIKQARVAVAPVTQRDGFTTVVTQEDGRFSFSGLVPGKYTLTAQVRGYLTQSFNQHDQFSSSIVVGPEHRSTGLLFKLPPEASISGMITDEGGEAIREAQITLYLVGVSFGEDATRVRSYARTDDRGFYRFGHLGPGKYLVGVSAKPWYAQHARMPQITTVQNGTSSVTGFGLQVKNGTVTANIEEGLISPLDVAYPITFYPGTTEPESASIIPLAKGDKATADLTLQPVPALHIKLSGSSAREGFRGNIFLQRPVLDGPPMQILTEMRGNPDGGLELVGVPAGQYIMKTVGVGGGSPQMAAGREVTLADNGEIESSQEANSAPLTAKLQFESGGPGRLYLLATNKRTRQQHSEVVKETGEVEFQRGLAPGSYEISLSGDRDGYIKNLAASGAQVSGRTIEIRGTDPVKLTMAIAVGEGEITGTALRDGNPFAGGMIVLVPADPGHNNVLFRRDQSDSDGTFTLANVVPGKYTVLALENGWDIAWTNPDVLEPLLPLGEAVEVQPHGKYNLKPRVQ